MDTRQGLDMAATALRKRRETIGEVLKTARLASGLSADAVAESCNVSRSRVYMWEAGDYVFPKNLRPLSLTLGIPLKRLEQVNGSPP